MKVFFFWVLAMQGRPVDFCFNADPIALKLVTQNKIEFRAGTGSCLPRLKCKRKARCVAVADSFVLLNVSTMKARCSLFMAAHKKKFNRWKEAKNNSIIKKQRKMALCEKNGILCTFGKIKTSFASFFICLLFNV